VPATEAGSLDVNSCNAGECLHHAKKNESALRVGECAKMLRGKRPTAETGNWDEGKRSDERREGKKGAKKEGLRNNGVPISYGVPSRQCSLGGVGKHRERRQWCGARSRAHILRTRCRRESYPSSGAAACINGDADPAVMIQGGRESTGAEEDRKKVVLRVKP